MGLGTPNTPTARTVTMRRGLGVCVYVHACAGVSFNLLFCFVWPYGCKMHFLRVDLEPMLCPTNENLREGWYPNAHDTHPLSLDTQETDVMGKTGSGSLS